MRPFRLHAMIKEASCLAKCLCMYKGFGFAVDIRNPLPDQVIGDEKRTFSSSFAHGWVSVEYL